MATRGERGEWIVIGEPATVACLCVLSGISLRTLRSKILTGEHAMSRRVRKAHPLTHASTTMGIEPVLSGTLQGRGAYNLEKLFVGGSFHE